MVSDTRWKSYEEVAAYLLDRFAHEFNLKRVERTQSIKGTRSGASWEIDAKGVRDANEAFVIVECRRYINSKQKQENVAALAYRIIDTGADGAILVSPLGLQAGAQKVAESERIIHVELHENSTPTEFCMQFFNKIFVGVHENVVASDRVECELIRVCEKCGAQFSVRDNERICSSCSVAI